MSRHSTSACLLGFLRSAPARCCSPPAPPARAPAISAAWELVHRGQHRPDHHRHHRLQVHRQPVVDPQHQHHRRDHRQHRQSAGHHAAAVQRRQRHHHLPYSICKDNGCGTVYNVGSTVRWSSTTFLGILGLFNATDGSLPLYLRTATGVTLPAGTYTDTIGLNWAWHLCAAGIGPVCVYDDGTASSSVNVTLTVLKDCFIDSARTSASAAPPGLGLHRGELEHWRALHPERHLYHRLRQRQQLQRRLAANAQRRQRDPVQPLQTGRLDGLDHQQHRQAPVAAPRRTCRTGPSSTRPRATSPPVPTAIPCG